METLQRLRGRKIKKEICKFSQLTLDLPTFVWRLSLDSFQYVPRVNYETRGVSLVKTNYRFRFDYFERSFFLRFLR